MSEPVQQSTFVTVLAWLILVFSGFATTTGLLQSLLVAFALPIEPFSASESAETPALFRFLFEYFEWFVWVTTAFWVGTLALAFGLLRRKEWARRAFVVIFALGVPVTLLMAALQQVMMSEMFSGATDVPPDATAMILILRVGSVIFAIAFLTGFAWLTLRLRSSRVRAEFH